MIWLTNFLFKLTDMKLMMSPKYKKLLIQSGYKKRKKTNESNRGNPVGTTLIVSSCIINVTVNNVTLYNAIC